MIKLAIATLVALFASCVTAQNATNTKQAAYKNKFLGCVQANPNFYYCQDGECYNTTKPANLTCSQNFDADYDNPIFPATYSFDHNINHLDIIELPLQNASRPQWNLLR